MNKDDFSVLLIAASVRESLNQGLDDGMQKKVAHAFGVYPHLGVLYLSSYLSQQNINTVVIDTNVEDGTIAHVVEKIKKINPSVIGISSMTFTFLYALNLAKEIRKHMATPIVMGGNHVSLYPQETLTHSCIDLVVIGEGEIPFSRVVNQMLQDGNFDLTKMKDIPGLAFRNADQSICITPKQIALKDIDSLPAPDLKKIDISKYYGCNLPRPHFIIMTSRGCPAHCSFCSQGYWQNCYREHSAERVVDEIERLINEYHAKAIDFFDSTFGINRRRLREIVRLVKERNLHFQCGILTRVSHIDDEFLDLMETLNCQTIAYGIESGDETILKKMNKNITLAQIKRATALTKKRKMNSVGFFLVGYPGETEKEIRNTIRLLKTIDLNFFLSNIVIPYPGSPLYQELIEDGTFKEDYWKRITIEGRSIPTPVANTHFSIEQLVHYRNKINRMPYFRWRSNLFNFRKLKLLADLRRPLMTLYSSIFGKKV